MRYNTFLKDKQTGKVGEGIVKNLLTDKYNMVVEDVSEEALWQKLDVDLLADDLQIEVKTDTSKTPNLFFETVSNWERKTEGCMLYTTADFLFYVHLGHEYILSIPVDLYRDWVLDNKEQFKEVSVRTSKAIGLLIPLKDLLHNINLVGASNLKGEPIDKEELIERAVY